MNKLYKIVTFGFTTLFYIMFFVQYSWFIPFWMTIFFTFMIFTIWYISICDWVAFIIGYLITFFFIGYFLSQAYDRWRR